MSRPTIPGARERAAAAYVEGANALTAQYTQQQQQQQNIIDGQRFVAVAQGMIDRHDARQGQSTPYTPSWQTEIPSVRAERLENEKRARAAQKQQQQQQRETGQIQLQHQQAAARQARGRTIQSLGGSRRKRKSKKRKSKMNRRTRRRM